jgi:hypothetical protein
MWSLSYLGGPQVVQPITTESLQNAFRPWENIHSDQIFTARGAFPLDRTSSVQDAMALTVYDETNSDSDFQDAATVFARQTYTREERAFRLASCVFSPSTSCLDAW